MYKTPKNMSLYSEVYRNEWDYRAHVQAGKIFNKWLGEVSLRGM